MRHHSRSKILFSSVAVGDVFVVDDDDVVVDDVVDDDVDVLFVVGVLVVDVRVTRISYSPNVTIRFVTILAIVVPKPRYSEVKPSLCIRRWIQSVTPRALFVSVGSTVIRNTA